MMQVSVNVLNDRDADRMQIGQQSLHMFLVRVLCLTVVQIHTLRADGRGQYALPQPVIKLLLRLISHIIAYQEPKIGLDRKSVV